MSLSPAKPNHRRQSLAVAVLGLASLTFSGGRAVDAGDKPGAAPAKKLSPTHTHTQLPPKNFLPPTPTPT